MRAMYPQFSLRGGPAGAWWDGWLMPFGSRPVHRYRLVVSYNHAPFEPIAWVVEPEISRRTWPAHRHLFGWGNLCPCYPEDDHWRYGRDDISRYVDLVVLWLGCHIHLEEYGRWPGPESPEADAHGSPTFRSDFGRDEWLARELIRRFGMRQYRLFRPMAGVPLALLEGVDWVPPLPPKPMQRERERMIGAISTRRRRAASSRSGQPR